MRNFIGYCGINCETCESRIATVNDDWALREKVAALWSKLNNVEIKPEMINCLGCRTDGVKTAYCESMCLIRKCAVEKKFETCGDCDDVDSCEKILPIFKGNQSARSNLKQR